MTRFVYVLPAGRLRWEVRVAGDCPHENGHTLDGLTSCRARHPSKSIHYRRKAHALIAARAIAIVVGGEVQEHGRDGVIQDPDSYGPDPKRSVG